MVVGDFLHRAFDRARHAEARPLGGGAGASITPSQTHGSDELTLNEVNFRFDLLAYLKIATSAQLFEFFSEFAQPPSVLLLGC